MNMVKNLTEGRPLNLLFFFALPMVAGNLFQQLYNMVDTAVVGKFVGEDAVAAVGSSFPIVFLSVAVASGLSMGCNVVVSQLFGAGRIHEMKTTISTAIISLGVLGLLIMGLGTLLAGPLLQLLGTDPDIMADSRTYLQIYFGGAVFLCLIPHIVKHRKHTHRQQIARKLGNIEHGVFIIKIHICLLIKCSCAAVHQTVKYMTEALGRGVGNKDII